MITNEINLFPALIGVISLSQGLLLSFGLIALGKNKAISNCLLGAWILVLSFLVFNFILDRFGWLAAMPIFSYSSYPTNILIGPLFYLYARTLIDPNFRFNLNKLFHFIPAVLAFFIKLPIYMAPAAERLSHRSSPEHLFERQSHLAIQIVVLLLYTMATIISVMQYRRFLKDNFSNIEKLKIDWIMWITCLQLVLTSVALAFMLSEAMFIYNYLLPLTLFALIYSASFFAFKQCSIFSKLHAQGIQVEPDKKDPENLSHLQLSENQINNNGSKYLKSGLKDEDLDLYVNRLKKLMETDRPYLNPQLRLPDIAKQLNLTNTQVSQVVNMGLNKTFFDLINEYRVEEAKKQLVNGKYRNLTIIAIAEEVGFNSKSTFNSVFKNISGETPSSYRGKHHQNLPSSS